jgi:hypothetical protein
LRLKFLDIESRVIGTLAVHDGIVKATGIGRNAANLEVLELGSLVRLHPADGDRWLIVRLTVVVGRPKRGSIFALPRNQGFAGRTARTCMVLAPKPGPTLGQPKCTQYTPPRPLLAVGVGVEADQ